MVTIIVQMKRANSCDVYQQTLRTLIYDGAHIITCYHAFHCANNETIKSISFYAPYATNFDIEKHKICSLAKFDEQLDLAILKVEEAPNGGFDVVSFSERPPFVGQEVHHISTPQSLPASYEHGTIASVGNLCGDSDWTSLCASLVDNVQLMTVCGMGGCHGSLGSSLLNKWGEILGISIWAETLALQGLQEGVGTLSPSYELLMDFVNSFKA